MTATRSYWIAFAACAAAATVPLLMTSMLPMADLPEHMAQIAIWKHFDDPCFRFADTFRISLATPYLLGSALSVALASFMSVSSAVKLTVWLSIMLLPLSLRALLTRGSADPWVSLLGFPLAYGYAFYWGFLNFSLAVPIGIFSLALVLGDRKRHTLLRTVLALALLSAHALMLLFCGAVTLLVAIVRRAPALLLPILPALSLFVAFVLRLRNQEQLARDGVTWMFNPGRVADFPSLLLANAYEPAGLLFVALAAGAVALTRPRVTRDGARWTVGAVAAILFLFAPQGAFGSAYLYPRFAVLTAVGILLLLDGPRASARTTVIARTVILALILGWMGVLGARFSHFDREVSEFELLLGEVAPARRVAQFNVDAFSEHVPGPVFWHFGALYQVRRGGIAAWSFARHYPQVIRFREAAEPQIATDSTPLDGIDWPGVLQYDYLLVRGADPSRRLFQAAPVPLRLKGRSGTWWLYETPRGASTRRTCVALNE